MNNHDYLPFKVGQLAEAKSFLQGFRGAWFRCKVSILCLLKLIFSESFFFFY